MGGGRGGLEAKTEFQANENQRQSFFWFTQELQQSAVFIQIPASSDKVGEDRFNTRTKPSKGHPRCKTL